MRRKLINGLCATNEGQLEFVYLFLFFIISIIIILFGGLLHLVLICIAVVLIMGLKI